MKQKEFLAKLNHDKIVNAIKEAESESSGEIRVHVQPRAGRNIRHWAERTFERIGMTKTKHRNGVLLFICSEQNRFVILGDKGIHEKVPPGFWDDIAARLTIRFKKGEFTDGIVEAILAAGEHLSKYFPPVAGEHDELPNDIDVSDE